MVAGGVLGSLAFVICAIVQFRINQTLPEIPQAGTSFVSFVNLYDGCAATLRSPNLPTRIIAFNSSLLDDKVNGAQDNYRINVDNAKNVTFELSFDEACSYPSSRFTMRLRGGQSYYGILSPQGFVYNRARLVKPTSGQQQSSVNINLLVPCSSVPKAVDWGSCNNRIKSQIYSDGIALCKYNKNSQSLCNPDEPA
ncbi:unnamed protein product [Toxocara canis]|uniref:LEA_2 domain-containing protein n=1 Tax=Toxocara canis TaxID=6265 RepID=A0A183U238_TOXCA|nr:unnamed protein product [Toxocara canis]